MKDYVPLIYVVYIMRDKTCLLSIWLVNTGKKSDFSFRYRINKNTLDVRW